MGRDFVLLGINEDAENTHPQLIGDVRHSRQDESMQLWTVSRQKFSQAVIGQIVGRIKVQSDEAVCRFPVFHPSL